MTSVKDKTDRAEQLRRAIRLKKAAARAKPQQRLPARPEDQEAHLGELQRSLWLVHQLDPSSPAYHLASAFRLSGPVDVARLEDSLNRVVTRHRLLRSTFRADRDRVLQIVHSPASLRLERFDAGDDDVSEVAVREARRPFDLATGPLVRMLFVENESGAERLLVLALHHILADERSLGFLWKELTEAYGGGLTSGEAPPQYDDFVHWARGREISGRAESQRRTDLDYWRQRLKPPPEDLGLPFERAGGVGESETVRGRLLTRTVDPRSAAAIRRLAAEADTTPFAVFAWVFRVLLHRYTEGRDVAFATPATQRSHPDTAGMIGYFLNPVVIRAPVDEDSLVGKALREFSRQAREALAHASIPFDAMVEELSPPRRGGRHPFFQCMFVYQETLESWTLGEVRLDPVLLDLGESKFDLTLFVSESEGGTDVAIEYRTELFDEVRMERMLAHYEALIHDLPGHLERPLAEVSMLSRDERDQLASFALGAPLDSEPPLLPRQILDQARRTPEAPAIFTADEEWSWAELEGAAQGLAHELVEQGVEPGDRVGLYLDRSPWMIAGVLGCHWAGAAYVPLDPAYPSARNRDVLDDADVAAVVTRDALRDRLPEGDWAVVEVLRSPSPPGPLSHPLAPPGRGGTHARSTTAAQRREGRVAAPLSRAGWERVGEGSGVRGLGERAAYLLYTSGSTGRPKGVVITHDNLRASNAARLQFYGGAPSRFLLIPSIAFDSSVAGLFWMLATGGALVLPGSDDVRDPQRLAQLIADRGVTGLLCVPSLYTLLLASGGDRLKSLETVIVAGESCPTRLVDEHFRQLPEARLFNEYGPTEATVWASAHEFEKHEAADVISIGRPIPGVRVEVLDDRGRRLPAGIPGQGWIAGPTLAEGYWHRPELTRKSFVERRIDSLGTDQSGDSLRMYRTGDRMSWTDDGRLLFFGRTDEQIKVRGFRIEPGEIEAALLAFPEVREAAVVVRPAKQLVAFVETGDATVSVGERLSELAAQLPEYMVPSRLVEIEELPQLPNGKVDRGRLREMELAAEPSTRIDSEVRVLDDRERALMALWEGLLGRSGFGVDDNFFRLGGHSLLTVEMAAAIASDFGASLSPADVFQHPTIRELARLIERQASDDTPPYAHLFPIQPGGRGEPLIFCIPHFFSDMVAARFRGERPVYGLRGVGLRPEGNRGRWPTMRDLGVEQVDEIRRRFPDEACIVAGYSFGATMAVETVRLMEERGLPVKRLILIAPMPIDFYRLGPFKVQIDALRRPVGELSLGEVVQRLARTSHPFTRRFFQRARQLLVTRPWRHLLCLSGSLRRALGRPLTPRILHADVRLERFRLHSSYAPGVIHTPTQIFNAEEPETDAAATWRPFFGGPLTVHQVPDPHLDEASIRAAKEQILDHLRDL